MSLASRISDLATRVASEVKLRGVPAGGTTGQVVTKANGVDFNAAWADVPIPAIGALPWDRLSHGQANLIPDPMFLDDALNASRIKTGVTISDYWDAKGNGVYRYAAIVLGSGFWALNTTGDSSDLACGMAPAAVGWTYRFGAYLKADGTVTVGAQFLLRVTQAWFNEGETTALVFATGVIPTASWVWHEWDVTVATENVVGVTPEVFVPSGSGVVLVSQPRLLAIPPWADPADAANASLLTTGTVADARLPVTAQAATLSATYASKNIFVNVKDFGATGDGATDDTAAIQAAVTASTWPATRATIYFPPGNYLLTTAISIDAGGATSTPNLDIVGWGARLTTVTAGISMLNITNSAVSLTRVRVQGFQFFVNAASTGIRLNNAEFCIIDKVDFLGSYGLAIKIEGTSTYNTISACTFSNLARGLHIAGNAQYLNVTGCHFGEQTAGSPLNWIQSDVVQVPNVSIADCTFHGEGNTLPAVNIVQGIGWTITGCKFAYCSSVALLIGADGTSYGHMVTGCVFQSNGADDIKVNGGRLNSIIGCFFGTKKSGTAVSTYCAVTILNTYGGAAGSDNTIAGCTSIATGTALLASFSAAAACANVNFIGNHYSIATVNTNTSAAIFGRDGIQIPLGKFITNGIAALPTVLARVTGIDAKTVAVTTLYTVPTGKTAVITGALVQSGAVVAITVGPTLGLGIAAGEDDLFASTALTGLTSNAKTWFFGAPGLQAAAPAGSVIKVGVDTASTGTSQTVAVALLGFVL